MKSCGAWVRYPFKGILALTQSLGHKRCHVRGDIRSRSILSQRLGQSLQFADSQRYHQQGDIGDLFQSQLDYCAHLGEPPFER